MAQGLIYKPICMILGLRTFLSSFFHLRWGRDLLCGKSFFFFFPSSVACCFFFFCATFSVWSGCWFRLMAKTVLGSRGLTSVPNRSADMTVSWCFSKDVFWLIMWPHFASESRSKRMMLLLKSVEFGSIDRHGDCFRNILTAATLVTPYTYINVRQG